MSGRGLRGRGIDPQALPRAAALTDLLLGGGGHGAGGGGIDRSGLARELERHLRCARLPERVRVNGYLLRTVLGPPQPSPSWRPLGPFRWSPVAVRRAVGLRAVRSCVEAGAAAPASAVSRTVEDLVAEGRRGLGRPGGLPTWLSTLAAPALAVVEAEAAAWATQLWSAIEWPRLGVDVQVGDADVGWVDPATRVRVSGRVDIRVPRSTGGPALLTMLPGHPTVVSRAELGLAALAAALGGRPPRGGGGALPALVVGWWPESGRALALPVDGALLEETAGAVARVVASVAGTSLADR